MLPAHREIAIAMRSAKDFAFSCSAASSTRARTFRSMIGDERSRLVRTWAGGGSFDGVSAIVLAIFSEIHGAKHRLNMHTPERWQVLCLRNRLHVNPVLQRLLDRTAVGDLKQSVPLLIGERSCHLDFALNVGDSDGFRRAVLAILLVDAA